jgi:hypothetical protein
MGKEKGREMGGSGTGTGTKKQSGEAPAAPEGFKLFFGSANIYTLRAAGASPDVSFLCLIFIYLV